MLNSKVLNQLTILSGSSMNFEWSFPRWEIVYRTGIYIYISHTFTAFKGYYFLSAKFKQSKRLNCVAIVLLLNSLYNQLLNVSCLLFPTSMNRKMKHKINIAKTPAVCALSNSEWISSSNPASHSQHLLSHIFCLSRLSLSNKLTDCPNIILTNQQ